MVTVRSFLLALACAVAVLMYRNENTAAGDQYRHRPLWRQPLDFFVPQISLQPEWFLRGNESKMVRQGLAVLLRDLNTNAKLTGMGRLIAAITVRDQLVHRECVTKSRKNATLSTKQQLVVILGLPRTGTTFLHDLLATSSDKLRAPKFHEYMDACPRVAEPRTVAGELRISVQALRLWFVRLLVPQLEEIHHMTAMSAEEDTVPLGQSMVSPMYTTAFHVPQYEKWLQTDSTEKFTEALQYVHYLLTEHIGAREHEEQHWLVKSPMHLAQVGELIQVYNPKVILWTHRDPVQQVSSLVSTTLQLVGMASDQVSSAEARKEIAQATVDFWFWALQRGVTARLQHHAAKDMFLDVQMDTLRNDPQRVIQAVYGKLGGWDFAFVPSSEKYQQRKLESLALYGLDEQEIKRKYQEIMSPLELNLV